MELTFDNSIEIIKLILTVGIFITSLVYGNQLSAKWSLKQKRKELHYRATEELFQIYGEFFALWKKWNFYLKHRKVVKDEEIELFHKEACEIEGKAESLILRVCSQFELDDQIIQDLGLLRQAFQTFREQIRYDLEIPWRSSDDPAYFEFKKLVIKLGTFISNQDLENTNASQNSKDAIIKITSNENEKKWLEIQNSKKHNEPLTMGNK